MKFQDANKLTKDKTKILPGFCYPGYHIKDDETCTECPRDTYNSDRTATCYIFLLYILDLYILNEIIYSEIIT